MCDFFDTLVSESMRLHGLVMELCFRKSASTWAVSNLDVVRGRDAEYDAPAARAGLAAPLHPTGDAPRADAVTARVERPSDVLLEAHDALHGQRFWSVQCPWDEGRRLKTLTS